MKIYNEIVLSWNEVTQQYDTVYEDSFDYNGKVLELQNGEDTALNTEFPEYNDLWHNENVEEYKQAIASRLSELILSKFGQIKDATSEEFLDLQKTFREGMLKNGRSNEDLMVVYEKDSDADRDDQNDVLQVILNWAGFIHPKFITLQITPSVDDIESSQFPYNLILNANAKPPLNINNIVSELNLDGVKLRETISQFLNLENLKTNIDKSKLSEFVETNFSELNPLTFTHILQRYQKFKNDLPFYRFRTDDFFEEYANTNIPLRYRLKYFFQEFERIKDEIPSGTMGYNAVTIAAQGTNYYIFKDDNLGEGREPRKLSIIEKDGTEKLLYEDTGGAYSRGLRITVFPRDSFVDGKWNGITKIDQVFDTYGGRTHFEDNNSNNGFLTADKLADLINDDSQIAEDDLIVLTSFDAIRWTNNLINSLKGIGAFDPKLLPPAEGSSNILDDLGNTINGEFNFPRDGKHIVQQGTYTSAASVTKPHHIVLNGFGSVSHTYNHQPGLSNENGSTGTNTLEYIDPQETPWFGDGSINQYRDPAGASSSYRIKVTRLKPNNTYTLRVWMSSGGDQTHFNNQNLNIGLFSPFSISALSTESAELDHPSHVYEGYANDHIHELVDTWTSPSGKYWEQREVSITTPENYIGLLPGATVNSDIKIGQLDWYVGGYQDDPFIRTVLYTGFEIIDSTALEEISYDGYYNNSNYGSSQLTGHYRVHNYDDGSSNDHDLLSISNNINWFYTPQRGWTLFFQGMNNEGLIDKHSVELYDFGQPVNEDQTGSTNQPITKVTGPSTENDTFGTDFVTVMMDVYLTEYDMDIPHNRILFNKESDYEMAICNNGLLHSQLTGQNYATCEPGEVLWAISLQGGGSWTWTGTNYVVPLNTWVNLALSYDGVNGVKIYADGELVSHATHNCGKYYSAPGETDCSPATDYTQGLPIRKSGRPFMIGARPGGSNPLNQWFVSNLKNASIDRVYVASEGLSQDSIRRISSAALGTQFGSNDSRTGYCLIGSKQFNRGEGVEVITEASTDADLAIATKFWPPDAEYNDWNEETAGYIISELQQYSNEDVPVYTGKDVIQLTGEVESLTQKVNDLLLELNNKNIQISTLESNLSNMNTARDWHGDCISVNSGAYECDDIIQENAGSVVATCSDNEELVLYCNPDSQNELCFGQPIFPYGGPISGQQACEGS